MTSSSLQHAYHAYNSANRAHYPLNGGFVTNLEAVEHYLVQAISHSPLHFGLAITIANMQTFSGKVTPALRGYRQSLSIAGSDAEQCQALTYLIAWHHYGGNCQQADTYLKQLDHINAAEAVRVSTLFKKLAATLSQPINYLSSGSPATSYREPLAGHAIITLGYALNDDGSMAPALIRRLELTLQLSQMHPESLILVTGGLSKQGKTESQQMKSWLIANGVKANRVIEEDQASNTIDNARLSLKLLALHRISSATIVSASIHVHRSQLLFETLLMQMNASPILFDHCAVEDGLSAEAVPTGQIRRNCYIDALRAYGLPAFNCEPFVQL